MEWRQALRYDSVCGVAWIVSLHLGAALALGLLGVAWTPLALLALGPMIALARWQRAVRAAYDDVEPRLWLRRAQHPRLFDLVDEATALLGLPSFDEIEAVPMANAFATHRQGRHVIGLGMPLLSALLRWELLAVIGHELGHVRAEDVLHPQKRAWHALRVLAHGNSLLSGLAKRALDASTLELAHVAHSHEHRADGWGGLAAGRGAVERTLRTLSGVDVLWGKLLGDLEVLARHGWMLDNAFAVLRRAWDDPAARPALVAAEQELLKEAPCLTHPSLGARSDHVEVSLERLTHRPPRDDECARALLADVDALERGWTRFLPGALFEVPAERLRVLDDRSATTQANLLRGREARAAIASRAGAAAADLPAHALVVLVHDALAREQPREWLVPVKLGRVEHLVKLQHFVCHQEEAADWVASLLYEAVERGQLPGEAPLAVRGVVEIGGKRWLIGELAEQLAKRRGSWDAVVRALRAGEERARTPAILTPAPPSARRSTPGGRGIAMRLEGDAAPA